MTPEMIPEITGMTENPQCLQLSLPFDEPVAHADDVEHSADISAIPVVSAGAIHFTSERARRFKSMLEEIPRLLRVNIEAQIGMRFKEMSSRSRNLFEKYLSLPLLTDIFYCRVKPNISGIKGCGLKSVTEFEDYIADARAIYEREVEQYLEDGTNIARYADREVRRRFPYLTDDEDIVLLGRLITEDKRLPALFLLHRYLKADRSTAAQICRAVLTHCVHQRNIVLSELSKQISITRERVRQISNATYSVPDYLREMLDEQLADFDGISYSSSLSVWSALAAEQMLPDDVHLIMGLVSIAKSRFTLRDYAHTNEEIVLVDKNAISGMREMEAYNRIAAAVRVRRKQDVTIDMRPYIESSRFSPTSSTDVDTVCKIFAESFATIPNVSYTPDYMLVVTAEKPDVEGALVKLLEEAGHSLGFMELWDALHSKHPELKLRNHNSMRSYIQRSERIKAKGKSGMYVLAEWTDEYVGSIPEYIRHLLTQSPTPMRLDDIVAEVIRQYPRTTRSSVVTFLSLDQGNHFCYFDDDYVGLRDREYQEGYIRRERRSAERKSPRERLAEYEQFIIDHQRFPFCSGPLEQEVFLYRWSTNIKGGHIESSPEILEHIKALPDIYHDYPQTLDEYKYQQHCDRVRNLYKEEHRLPKASVEPLEYVWYRKNFASRDVLKGIRKTLFERLLADIEVIQNGGVVLF